MPYPTEHAQRINDPGKYKRLRRRNDDFAAGIDVIYGVMEDGKIEVQAIRFDKDKFTATEAKTWLREHDYKTTGFEPATEKKMGEFSEIIERVEIFRVGDYGDKGTFDENDLDAIAASYDPAQHEAPITVDHAQTGPAFGWVCKVWREGASLFASLKDVSKKLLADIMAGRYKKRSIELYEVDGKPLLRAVSFLGAMIPHVKGMADIVFGEAFDDPARAKQLAWGDATTRFPDQVFMEMPTSPDPTAHGVLAKQMSTGTMLDHWHNAYLDERGNGFTGFPCYYDSEYGGMKHEGEGHQHVVNGGMVEASGDPEHTHSLVIVTEMAETEKVRKENDMDHKQFDEMKSAREAVEAENVTLKAQINAMTEAARKADLDKRFDEAWKKAFDDKRVTGATLTQDRATFLALANVQFSEGQKPAHESFLESLIARPRVVPDGSANGSGKENDDGQRGFTRGVQFADKGAATWARTEEIRRSDPNIKPETAYKRAYAEIVEGKTPDQTALIG